MTEESWLLEKAECKPHANYTLKCSLMGTQCSCLAINKFCNIEWILYLLELGELLYRIWGFRHFNAFDCTHMHLGPNEVSAIVWKATFQWWGSTVLTVLTNPKTYKYVHVKIAITLQRYELWSSYINLPAGLATSLDRLSIASVQTTAYWKWLFPCSLPWWSYQRGCTPNTLNLSFKKIEYHDFHAGLNQWTETLYWNILQRMTAS